MKTKINLLLSLCTVFIFSAKAQVFSGGVVAGVSTGAVQIKNVGNQFTNVLQGNNIYGYEAGVYAKLMLSPFYIKPMALYNFSMGDITSQSESNSPQTNNFTLHRFEVPVLFGFRIIGPLSIEAGPSYNYIIQSTSQFNNNSNDNVSITQSSGLGYRAGLVLEINRLLITGSYSGVTINSNGINSATFKEPYKIVFGLGIKLGKIKSKK